MVQLTSRVLLLFLLLLIIINNKGCSLHIMIILSVSYVLLFNRISVPTYLPMQNQ